MSEFEYDKIRHDDLVNLVNLTKKYGKTLALDRVSLNVAKGKIIALLGPNGSGKTTLIKILAGLIQDYRGTVKIDGQSVGAKTKALVSYLPDETYFSDWMKVKDALHLFRDCYRDFDSDKAIKLLHRFNLNEKMRIKQMSKGMKEKLQLVLVMSRNASLYILDEPIGGVDPAARDVILDTILSNYAKDSTVLLSTHLIHDIERIFDEVIFLKEGKIVLHRDAESLREETGKSVDELFREEFRC